MISGLETELITGGAGLIYCLFLRKMSVIVSNVFHKQGTDPGEGPPLFSFLIYRHLQKLL
jgi:hypothetical protein